ncbi:hypothetical protein TOPH_04502 [Tolypocladium ophioglossoides CBS 100239]|uniref:Uncharacterized protein n=1 Tax=Tolypocladium ophioglossoides (strain CBS 100239) TaxID=1163406 RepID=A0A0L0N9Q4_TOLOC|nr:hypothetical protein TOPH_04502 [Tolypocladium ophioglossoides CBS 100239]
MAQPPPVNNANSKFSPSTPLYEVTKCSSITSSTVIPESTTSVLLTVATPTPTGRSLISLTPIITGPITVLSSGARKGVGVLPTEVPVVFVKQPSLSTSTATSYYSYETAESDEMKENHPHPYDDPHANTEKALIAVGSVVPGATIITFFVFWLAWKCFKTQGRKHGFRNWKPSLSASPLLDKPKQLMMDLASRVPVLKKRLTKRSWTNIDKPYDHAVWEKKLPAPDARLENPRGITVHTAITTRSENEEPRHASARGNVPNHSSTIQPQFNQTLPSNYQVPYNRMSDISSLSSGFGDGDITFPPANSNATTINTTYLVVPAPVAQRSSVSDTSQRRDTMYTEASEDSVPRFRSINSWVRQQTGWVKRAKQDEMVASNAPPVPSMPPEQEFRLMMPDGEEPRRVDVTMGSSGMALHVEFER